MTTRICRHCRVHAIVTLRPAVAWPCWRCRAVCCKHHAAGMTANNTVLCRDCHGRKQRGEPKTAIWTDQAVTTILRLITAGLLLVAVFTRQSADYYTLLRLVCCLVAGYLAYRASLTERLQTTW